VPVKVAKAGERPMFSAWFGLERRRRRALARLGPAVDGDQDSGARLMRDYLATPLPQRRIASGDAGLVALDFETTGLDPRNDHILSIGLVGIDGLSIRLASAQHHLVNDAGPIPERSAVIHGITDDHAAAGQPLRQLLPALLQALAGRVIVVHHAAVERQFLQTACERLYGAPFVGRFIDTEVLARRGMERRQQPIRASDLRLFNLRRAYQLPRYPAHNALSDALATAELFLLLAARADPAGRAPIGDFF
jgi:DNA polymerase-3 subunit epsilon